MIGFQWPTMSMILIVLSLIHIDASSHRSVRQTTTNMCPVPDLPMCDYVQCANGRCVEDNNNPDCYQCQCYPGYTGQLCDESVVIPSACNPGCQNGGQCIQTLTNTFICKCPTAYTGQQCETSIPTTHPCMTMSGSVCKNGGTCTMNGADYICNCPIGWTGKNCDTQDSMFLILYKEKGNEMYIFLKAITTCDSNPCGAHGTCTQHILLTGLFVSCNCENRWTGKYCDVNLDGTTTTTSTTTISANMNITTTTASLSRPCSSNPCSNGASCFNTGNTFLCLCQPGWAGALCDVPSTTTIQTSTTPSNINHCSPNPCLNGGTCYRHGNSYVCTCPSQYTGLTCGLVKTTTAPAITTPNTAVTCNNQPCQNGGTCFSAGNSYFCYCGGLNSQYTGKNCETISLPPATNCPLNCAPGYCVNSGSSQNAYACMCKDGTMTPTSCPST
ncbi:unnamed protein product [Rotaria sp. Silwood2]|nr:unnamed protein product [Rotaria sp. Silwood2]